MSKDLPEYKRKYSGDYTYLICSVRKATNLEKKALKKYVNILRVKGEQILYPAEDTNQEDPTGRVRICKDHTIEISESSKIKVAWNPNSKGSYIDLGTAFHEYFINNKPILLSNRKTVEQIVKEQKDKDITKTYEMVLLELDKKSRNLL